MIKIVIVIYCDKCEKKITVTNNKFEYKENALHYCVDCVDCVNEKDGLIYVWMSEKQRKVVEKYETCDKCECLYTCKECDLYRENK